MNNHGNMTPQNITKYTLMVRVGVNYLENYKKLKRILEVIKETQILKEHKQTSV